MADRVGQQLGNYRLIRLLGKGGLAEVYLGEHVYLETQAAIKVLLTRLASQDMEPFRLEAKRVAHLEHPHIVRVNVLFATALPPHTPTRGKNCAICYNESGNFSSQAIWSARPNHVGRLPTRPSLFVFHRSLQGDQPCRSHVSPPTLLARPGPGILATQGSITTARTAYSALFTCVTIAQSSSVHFNSVSF